MGVFNRSERATGSEFTNYREDWAFRTTYNYDDRYMFEYNGAYNGSEKFSKDNFHIGELYVKLLIATDNYSKADKVLSDMNILPFEGQTGSHILWRDIKLHLAASAIDRRDYKAALLRIDEALQWPETLGVGKPYEDLLNTDLEKVLKAIVYARKGDAKAAEAQLALIQNRDSSVEEFYRKATDNSSGKYVKICPMLGNLDASLDKKLF